MCQMLEAPAKSYDACIECRYRKVTCCGPRTNSMSIERWAEWIKTLCKKDGVTRAGLAELAGVGEATVSRIFAKKVDTDVTRHNANKIEQVFFGTGNKYPCALAAAEHSAAVAVELEAKAAELAKLSTELEGVRLSSLTDQERLHKMYRDRIAHLLEEEKHLCAEVEHLHDEVAFLRRTVERYEKLLDEVKNGKG